MVWRYLAQRLPSGEWLGELPLTDASITRSISAPGKLAGTLPVELEHLIGPDGLPILTEWGTAVWAEENGEIRGGGIVDAIEADGESLTIDCVGVSGYPQGIPWLDSQFNGIRVDPLDMVRKIWDHVQSYDNGNLGVHVASTTSPVRVGTPATKDADGNDVDAEPFHLSWWETTDLGETIDGLAESAPFDYLERTAWDADGTSLRHDLLLGYPRIGARRPNLRFEIGVNVSATPKVTLEEYASEVFLLGAGEGRKMKRARLTADTGRLRRVAVVADKSVTTKDRARSRAADELAARVGTAEIEDLQVINHPNAPFGSFDVGDEIRVTGNTGWADFDLWVRVMDLTITPESDTLTLKVQPS